MLEVATIWVGCAEWRMGCEGYESETYREPPFKIKEINLRLATHKPGPMVVLELSSPVVLSTFAFNSMRLTQLIERLRQRLPTANDRRLACLAMLMCDRDPQFRCLSNEGDFVSLLDEIQIRMQSIDDQHAAVANELDQLALTQPCEFEPKHIWTLIRAIKVQSQFVDMLTGIQPNAVANS